MYKTRGVPCRPGAPVHGPRLLQEMQLHVELGPGRVQADEGCGADQGVEVRVREAAAREADGEAAGGGDDQGTTSSVLYLHT